MDFSEPSVPDGVGHSPGQLGAGERGMMPTIHLLSKLLMTTIGIMASEDEDVSFEGILDVFDVEDETPN